MLQPSGQKCYDGRIWATWTTYTGSWVITTSVINTTLTIQTSTHYAQNKIRIAGGGTQNQISIFKMF